MSASNLVAVSVWKSIESTRSVTEDQLSILHFLFGKNLERATRIVDQRGVKRISGEPSGRFIFQRKGLSFEGLDWLEIQLFRLTQGSDDLVMLNKVVYRIMQGNVLIHTLMVVRLWENRGGKRSISVLLNTIVPVIHSSMTL